MKRQVADKWSTDVLEQIAAACNIASKARTEEDWLLFLNAIYQCASTLPNPQRPILLLHQEHGLTFSDIGRVFNIPHSTVMRHLSRAIANIVRQLRAMSLIDIRVRYESRLAEGIFVERFTSEEKYETTRSGFDHEFDPPWFYEGEPIIYEDDT